VTILDQIIAGTRSRLAAAPLDAGALHRAAMERAAAREPHAFARALSQDGINIIAEIKAASPSAGPIVENPDVEAIAGQYREGGAAALSVVTEPQFFRGDRMWLERARRTAGLPVIMKDFVIDSLQIAQGAAAGADAMLLLASVLDTAQLRGFIEELDRFGCDAVVEVHDEEELGRAIGAGARIIGVNNRDLRDFRVDLAISERLGAVIPEGVIRVAESGIRTYDDVMRLRHAGFQAFLVGESLLRQNDRAAAVRRLREDHHP
jgi:indole-3-glycerol phosphate synthase